MDSVRSLGRDPVWGLNENIPPKAHVFEHLVPAIDGAVWRSSGGVALLDEVCLWRWTLGI